MGGIKGRLQHVVSTLLAVLGLLVCCVPSYAERLPEFLNKVQPSEIFPSADRYGKPEGKPMVARVYKGDEQLGVVFITTDVVNTRGYSSKPIDTMIALANDGTIAGAKLVEHHEPIPTVCPKCNSKRIKFFGSGTQKVEEELRRHFKSARIARLDQDVTKNKQLAEDILHDFGAHKYDILF